MLTDAHTANALAWLNSRSIHRGDRVGIALHSDVGIGLATQDDEYHQHTANPFDIVAGLEDAVGPRWVWWDRATADLLAQRQITIGRCWDTLTVHRLLHGGWRTSIPLMWAWLHDLPPDTVPALGQLGLLDAMADEGDDPDNPVRPDGHLRPEWVGGGWRSSPERLVTWARCALEVAGLQEVLLSAREEPDRARSAAHSESVAEFLCAELGATGLPFDTDVAEAIMAESVGPRPANEAEAEVRRNERDEAVLVHAPLGPRIDLRSPADVKAMLKRVAVDIPDTRAWRLREHRDAHPVVEALLTWRKAERIATTYGYRWLDEHVVNGRLRGEWSSSDGAAGRMTASAGLHNLPSEMRPAVVAKTGHVFVRADLGQIEPRVLAAVSGDRALIGATIDDDLYMPIANRLGVSREIAKVAVLGAMYGSTTGESAHALRGLERAYPTAMSFLESAADVGRAGRDIFTVGGRRITMWVDDSVEGDIDKARRVAASRGRFARNATIQGAAAEFFKVWAIIVRARGRTIGAEVVLCLHDELLVHVPEQHAAVGSEMVIDALREAAHRWSPHPDVRYLAETSIVRNWAEAKD
jgi:DNA polymerase-1